MRSPVAVLMAVALGAAGTARAERLPVRVLTTAEGLPRDQLSCVHSDARGFLWFCTEEGLVRYDGHATVTFGRADGLSPPAVRSFLHARDGRYWVGAAAGLYEFRVGAADSARRFRAVPRPDGRPGGVNALAESRDGSIWVASGRGLGRLTSGPTGERLDEIDVGLPREVENDAIVRAVVEDEAGVLWVAAGSGLYRRPPTGPPTRLTAAAGLPVDEVRALALDARGRLWAGTRAGLCLVDRDAVGRRGAAVVTRIFTGRHGLPSSNVNSLLVTGDTVWAGTTGGAAETLLTPSGGLAVSNVLAGFYAWAMGTDARGDVWIGSDSGARHLVRRGFTTFGEEDGLPTPRISSLFETRDGRVCAITLARSVHPSCFDGRRFSTARIGALRAGLDPGWGWSQLALQDRQGGWWIPTGEGLWRFPPGPVEALASARPVGVYTSRDGLRSDAVFRLFEDSQGGVWVATFAEDRNGLSRVDSASGAVHTFGAADGLPDPLRLTVYAMAEDRSGQVWVGLDEGLLLRFRDGRFATVLADAVGGDVARKGELQSLLVDARGRLWIASAKAGLGRIDRPEADSPRVTWYGTAQGLVSDTTWALAAHGGDVFVATGRGVDRLDPETNQVRHYSAEDGLPRGEVFGSLRDRHGRLWFATTSGAARLAPADEAASAPPATFVTAVRVAGAPLPIAAVGAEAVGGVTLQPGDRRIEIDYVSPGAREADGLRYQYRLEGVEEEWSPPTESRTVTFAGAAPGRYRFAVRSVSGAAAGPSAAVSFAVIAPVWRRGWFLALAAAGLAALAVAFHRARVARLVAVEQVRARIAADLHDDVGASLSRIAILGEVVRRQAQADLPGAVPALTSITDTARTLVDAMSDVVWSIDPRLDDLEQVIVRTRALAADLFDGAGIAWTLEAPPDAGRVGLAPEQRRHLYLILKEGLTNVARHARASRVAARVALADGRLLAEIEDDGVGLAALPAPDGDGHGLVNMRSRASALGGRLDLGPRPGGRGTRVRLDVPLAGPA